MKKAATTSKRRPAGSPDKSVILSITEDENKRAIKMYQQFMELYYNGTPPKTITLD